LNTHLKAGTILLIFLMQSVLPDPLLARKAKKSHSKKPPDQTGGLISLGFPFLNEAGLIRKHNRYDYYLVTGGYYSRKIKSGRIDNFKFSFRHFGAKWRHRPFRDPFYTQLGAAYQNLQFTGTANVEANNPDTKIRVPVDAKLSITTIVTMAQIGLMWQNSRHLFWGFSVGLQVPLYSDSRLKTSVTDDPFINEIIQSVGDYQEIQRDVEKASEKAGKISLPVLQILELGYFF